MHRLNSLRIKMTLLFTAVLAFFCVVMLIVVQLAAQLILKDYIYNNIYSLQNEMDKGVKMIFDDVSHLYSRLIGGNTLESLLKDDSSDESTRQEQYQSIINSSGLNYDLYGDVVLYGFERFLRFSGNDELNLPDNNFLESILKSQKPLQLKQGGVISDEENDYILIGIGMTSYGTTYGAAVFYIKEQSLKSIFSSEGAEGYSFCINDQKTILSHPQRQYIGSTIFDQDFFDFENLPNYKIKKIDKINSIMVTNNLDLSNQYYNLSWHIVSIFDYDVLTKDIESLQSIIIVMGIIIAIIAGVVGIRLSYSLTSPINNLNNAIKEFTKNGQKGFMKKTHGDEIAQLEKAYDDMIIRLVDLMETNKRDMEKQRKLELEALQLQINPHFLYNTLDAIAWMAKLEKQTNIEKLVMALSKFFRISLHKGDKYITVKEEFELIKNFIDIELVRFPSKFTIEYDLSEDVKDCITLKLLLQPIVENAIKHGISQSDHMGNIILKAYLQEGDIVYEVIDNGKGFDIPIDIMQTLRSQNSVGGYGLKNVDERIKLEYGKKYGISIQSQKNAGTKVTVRIASQK